MLYHKIIPHTSGNFAALFNPAGLFLLIKLIVTIASLFLKNALSHAHLTSKQQVQHAQEKLEWIVSI